MSDVPAPSVYSLLPDHVVGGLPVDLLLQLVHHSGLVTQLNHDVPNSLCLHQQHHSHKQRHLIQDTTFKIHIVARSAWCKGAPVGQKCTNNHNAN